MPHASRILAWTLVAECAVPEDVGDLLVSGKGAVAAYRTLRDTAIFTSKRLVVRDAQGITGTKVQIHSLPYCSILMWSSENGRGLFDVTAELTLCTKLGPVTITQGPRCAPAAGRIGAAGLARLPGSLLHPCRQARTRPAMRALWQTERTRLRAGWIRSA